MDTPTRPVDDLVTQVQLCDSGVGDSDVGTGVSEVVPAPLPHVKHLQRTGDLTQREREMDYNIYSVCMSFLSYTTFTKLTAALMRGELLIRIILEPGFNLES